MPADPKVVLNMYGVSREALKTAVEENLEAMISREPAKMLALSMLSDAQELMQQQMVPGDHIDKARQMINRAKYVLDTHTMEKHNPAHSLLKQLVEALPDPDGQSALYRSLWESVQDYKATHIEE